ncbi:hypothetical protein L218DRAFT_552252 [Marasmius fiardii PR-910]|nr:hypothetical protein L218DRAFT_552252 [Marasmius fiardii PR-910]
MRSRCLLCELTAEANRPRLYSVKHPEDPAPPLKPDAAEGNYDDPTSHWQNDPDFGYSSQPVS